MISGPKLHLVPLKDAIFKCLRSSEVKLTLLRLLSLEFHLMLFQITDFFTISSCKQL